MSSPRLSKRVSENSSRKTRIESFDGKGNSFLRREERARSGRESMEKTEVNQSRGAPESWKSSMRTSQSWTERGLAGVVMLRSKIGF